MRLCYPLHKLIQLLFNFLGYIRKSIISVIEGLNLVGRKPRVLMDQFSNWHKNKTNEELSILGSFYFLCKIIIKNQSKNHPATSTLSFDLTSFSLIFIHLVPFAFQSFPSYNEAIKEEGGMANERR